MGMRKQAQRWHLLDLRPYLMYQGKPNLNLKSSDGQCQKLASQADVLPPPIAKTFDMLVALVVEELRPHSKAYPCMMVQQVGSGNLMEAMLFDPLEMETGL